MKTFWQLLRIGFWMLPLQRALTVIGFMVLVAGQVFSLPYNMPGSSLPITFFGVMLMMIVPLLTGGVFLRMLSSSRALLLRPILASSRPRLRPSRYRRSARPCW